MGLARRRQAVPTAGGRKASAVVARFTPQSLRIATGIDSPVHRSKVAYCGADWEAMAFWPACPSVPTVCPLPTKH
jgi:hypothetical protein